MLVPPFIFCIIRPCEFSEIEPSTMEKKMKRKFLLAWLQPQFSSRHVIIKPSKRLLHRTLSSPPWAFRIRSADRAEELHGPSLLVEQSGLELERRQQASDSRRDDRAGRSARPRHRVASLDDHRRQRVRLAAAAAAAGLLRRQRDAQRRCAARRFLRRRARRREEGPIADGSRQFRRPRPELLLADAVQEIVQDHDHQRRPSPRDEPVLPRRLAEGSVAAGEYAVFPRPLPAVAARPRRRQQCTNF